MRKCARAGPLLGPLSAAHDTTLRDYAAKRGLIYGAAVGSFELRDGAFVAVLGREAACSFPNMK